MEMNLDPIRYFKSYLDKFMPISELDFSRDLLPYCEVKKFSKKEKLTKVGDIENYFNFITQGIIRKYYSRGKEEINTQISPEGQLILSQESFHSRLPSEYTVEAIEASTVVRISYDNLERVYASSHEMERLGRLLITYSMVIKDRWQMQMVKMTPRERFLNFISKNGELLMRVPQKYLASYLNIKPETFSRFKHLIKPFNKSSS